MAGISNGKVLHTKPSCLDLVFTLDSVKLPFVRLNGLRCGLVRVSHQIRIELIGKKRLFCLRRSSCASLTKLAVLDLQIHAAINSSTCQNRMRVEGERMEVIV